MELYDYGEFDMDTGHGFRIKKTGWHKIKNGIPATEEQQATLGELGFGEDRSLTENGARVIIEEIRSNN